MTEALKKAFERAARLPDAEQDSLAAAILAEIESEDAWEAAFAGSETELGNLADHALEEHLNGKTRRLDPRNP